MDVGWLVKPDADGVDAGIEGGGLPVTVVFASSHPPGQNKSEIRLIVRGDQDSRATLMPIYGDLYQIKL